MSKKIELTRGQVAVVDDENFDWLNQWKWCALKIKDLFLAVRTDKDNNMILMHREIYKLVRDEDAQIVIHYNKNSLDNRFCNLRSCTQSQKAGHHRKIKKTTTSVYKGVSWKKDKKKWKAYIRSDCKQKHLGYYESEEEAARAYDRAAAKYFEEFAWLNFPEEQR